MFVGEKLVLHVPKQCELAKCPQATVAKGFVLSSGNLATARIALLLETPDADDGAYLVRDLVDGAQELARRRAQYPMLEQKFVQLGAPAVSRAGSLLWSWIMGAMGLHRTDVAVFSTLNCYCGKDVYPKGSDRKRAEATCADLWLRPLVEWEPTVSIVAMHPSALIRDIVPLPVVLRAVERAKQFAADGERVLLLFGGKAAKHWLGYGENTSRWCCHWQRESAFTRSTRSTRWCDAREARSMKVAGRRSRKLTTRTALARLVSAAVVESSETSVCLSIPGILPIEWTQILSLIAHPQQKVAQTQPTEVSQ